MFLPKTKNFSYIKTWLTAQMNIKLALHDFIIEGYNHGFNPEVAEINRLRHNQ